MGKLVAYSIAALGVVVALAVIIIPIILIQGFVLTILWDWFIVTTFKMPQLSVKYALGLILILNFITFKPDTWKDDRSQQEKRQTVINLLCYPFIVLVLGWLIHILL